MTSCGQRLLTEFMARKAAKGAILCSDEIVAACDDMCALFIAEERKRWEEERGVKPGKPAPVVRKRNELLDALVTLCGGEPEHTTKSEFRTAATALSEIKTVCPNLTVEELGARVACYKQKNKDWHLTPPALAKWWSHLGGGARTESAKRDIYIEPAGWRSVLQNMYQLSNDGIRDKQWLDLGPDTRREVLNRMRSA